MSTSAVGSSGSMIDVTGIVSKLMMLESRPLEALQAKVNAAQLSVSAMSQLKSVVDAAYAAANALQDLSVLSGKSASASDASVATPRVTAASQTVQGAFTFEYKQAATAQRTVFSGVTDPSAARALERVRIFNPSEDGSSSLGAFDVTLDFASASLNDIRDAINANEALKGKVSASVVKRADAETGADLDYVLVISGAKTGYQAQFDVEWVDVAGDTAPPTREPDNDDDHPNGLSFRAKNATALVDGITVGSASQVFEHAIPGLSIEASKLDTPVRIQVTDNRGEIRTRMQAFADAVSAMNKKVAELTKPASEGVKGGPLAANAAVLGLTSSIFSAYVSGFSLVSEPGVRYAWNKLGLEYTRSGTVSFNASTFDAAMTASDGFGTKFLSGFTSSVREVLNSFRGTAGTIQSGIQTMQTSLSSLRDSQSDKTQKLERTRTALLAKYSALDAKLVSMGQSSNNIRSALAGLSA
jgi:flagellar hook-associated protein 2